MLTDRISYGNPTNFLTLRHESVNEQGVVILFGMLAENLGYRIETVQKGFPDCEAIRQVAPNRWQRVQIEFEFESKNYRDYGHPLPVATLSSAGPTTGPNPHPTSKSSNSALKSNR